MKKARLTAEDREKIIQMAWEGWSNHMLADRFQCSYAEVARLKVKARKNGTLPKRRKSS